MIRLPNWVGDVVMSLPAIDRLSKLGYPIVFCGKAWAKPLIQNFNAIQFVEISGKVIRDIVAVRANQRKRAGLTIGITFPDSLSSALVFRLAGIQTIGYRDDGRSWLLKWPIDKPTTPIHAVEKWFYLANQAVQTWQNLFLNSRSSDAQIWPEHIETPDTIHLSLSNQQKQGARALVIASGLIDEPYILIAPTATGLHQGNVKVWPYFGALTLYLQQAGYKVVACPPRHEQAQAIKQCPTATILAATDLGTFAALAQQAALVVCNDSGVSHICAAVGANQITLFGVTDPKQTGPWSKTALALGENGRWPTLEETITAVEQRLQTT